MNEEIPTIDIFKHGLIAITQSSEDKEKGLVTVVHFCGYMHPPTKEDVKLLEEELNTDPEFNLVGRINKDVVVVPATPEMVEFYTGAGSKKNKIRIDKEEDK